MSWHRCNTDAHNTSRVQRILIAVQGERDQDALEAVVLELGDCPNCLRQALFQTVGITSALIRDHAPDHIMAFEMMVAAAEAADKDR